MKSLLTYGIMLGLLFCCSSCSSSTDSSSQPSRIAYTMQVNSLGNEITDNSDALYVTSVRLVLETFELGLDNGPTVVVNPSEIEARVDDTEEGNSVQLFSNTVAGGTYRSTSFGVGLADDISVENPEYSILVTGTYGGTEFTFGTDIVFRRDFNFTGALFIPNQDFAVDVTITTDIEDWFTDREGAVLDPMASENRSLIETNIETSFDIEITGSSTE
ncbi:MAG: hypothetical protein R3281_06585 [Balneolaceae bacterium]|nr:hypothetical protein [Balneolaceae bacterium]